MQNNNLHQTLDGRKAHKMKASSSRTNKISRDHTHYNYRSTRNSNKPSNSYYNGIMVDAGIQKQGDSSRGFFKKRQNVGQGVTQIRDTTYSQQSKKQATQGLKGIVT